MDAPTCPTSPHDLFEQFVAGEITHAEFHAGLGVPRPRLTEQQLRERLAVAEHRIAQLELREDIRAAQGSRQLGRTRDALERAQREYDELAAKYDRNRVRLQRLTTIHVAERLGEREVVRSIVAHAHELMHPGLEVHIFAGGRRVH